MADIETLKEELSNVYPHYVPKKQGGHKVKFYLSAEDPNKSDEVDAAIEETTLYARRDTNKKESEAAQGEDQEMQEDDVAQTAKPLLSIPIEKLIEQVEQEELEREINAIEVKEAGNDASDDEDIDE